MKYEMIYDRIRGALYGVAVGDALGGPLEFMDAGSIRKQHGRVTEMIGGGWLHLRPGEITDDTQMTLAVARGIRENPNDPVPAVGRYFIDWYHSAPKDVGATCSTAISIADQKENPTSSDWRSASRQTHQFMDGRSAGNGALMRTIYPAVYYGDPKEREDAVEDIAEMTHFSSLSTAICIEYAEAVHKAIFGGHPITTLKGVRFKPGSAPTGYVLDTWSNVLEAIWDTDDFEEAVVEAVNRGGDADTIGAITGGLAGACYGYKNIPERWIECLDPELRAELDELAMTAYNAIDEYYHSESETQK